MVGIDRFGDPASSANTDAFHDHSINTAKAGLGYSGAILSQKAWSNSDETTINKIEKLMEKTWKATSVDDLKPVVDEFHTIMDSMGL